MSLRLPAPIFSFLLLLLPIIAIFGARALTFTAWAQANAGWAALLFAWVVADALLLTVLAKAKEHRPEGFKVAAALALAAVVILFGAAGPVQAVYLDLPSVLLAAGATLSLFLGWSAFRLVRGYAASGSATAAVETVFPPALVGYLSKDLGVLWLALARWNAPADVPNGSRPFIYHTYLTPMIATLLALQVIEMSVVHFLLMLWSPVAAWMLFALSTWGLIWMVALLKSLRINPVLLEPSNVRVRFGMLDDFSVPISGIAQVDRPFSSDELESRAVLNLGFMSSPNVHLRLAEPIAVSGPFGTVRCISGVALRLDDSAGFISQMKAMLEHREQN